MLVLAILLACAGTVSADAGFGIKGGVGLSSYTGADWSDFVASQGANNKMGFSFSAGIFAELYFTQSFGIEADFLYSSLTRGYKAGDSYVEYRENIFEVPVYLKYAIPVGNGKVVIMGGPDFFYTFGDISMILDLGVYGSGSDSAPASDLYENLFRIGVAGGIGYETESYRFAGLYKRTLTEAVSDYSRHSQNFALELGYKF